MIETQKLVIIKKKTDPIAVANKKLEIQTAEKGKNNRNYLIVFLYVYLVFNQNTYLIKK